LGFITVVIKPAVSVRGQAPINQENRTRTAISFRVRTILSTERHATDQEGS